MPNENDYIQESLPKVDMSFLAPNERDPNYVKKIIENAPEGVYIGVGTERCLFAATMSSNITNVIMADCDPAVNLYNKINLEMIKNSKDFESYKKLRLTMEFDTFFKILPSDYIPTSIDRDLRRKDLFYWFRESFNTPKMIGFHKNKTNPKHELKFSDTYLHSRESFDKLKKMVDNDKIEVITHNISSIDDIKKISEKNLNISIYDISNAWWLDYVDESASSDRSFVLGPNSNKTEPIIVVTDRQYAGADWYTLGFRKSELIDLKKYEPEIFKELFSRNFFSTYYSSDASKSSLLSKIQEKLKNTNIEITPNCIINLEALYKDKKSIFLQTNRQKKDDPHISSTVIQRAFNNGQTTPSKLTHEK